MYYGFEHENGVNWRHADDNSRIGYVEIFESRLERDEWVDYDPMHREVLTSTQAKREMLDRLGYKQREQVLEKWETIGNAKRYMSTSEVVALYLEGED